MSIEIVELEDGEQWDEYVDRSSAGTFFHRYGVLQTAEEHAGASLYPLVGYKGEEPVGLFPTFEIRKSAVSTIFSPPPGQGMSFLGPVSLNDGKLKQRKRERRRRRFVEGCLEWLEERVGPSYYRVVTSLAYDDSRPFTWNDYEVTPRHTYLLDLTREPDELKRSFSKSLRRYLEPDDEERFRIEQRGEDGIRFVHEQVRSRYEAQGKTYTVPVEFLLDLYEELPDGSVRPYIGEIDGERTSGIVTFEGESTIYYSAGGGKPDAEYPINDLLHWQIIRDARDRGVETYDLCGANTPRICEYKSKFNPNLGTYYEIEKGTRILQTAANLYKKYR
ncbi:GNAT family N-acetyltransferase [Natrialbaceae archaeon A-gly3]